MPTKFSPLTRFLTAAIALVALLGTLSACGAPTADDPTSLTSLFIYTQDWDQDKIVTASKAAVVDLARLGTFTYDGSDFQATAGSIAYEVDPESNKGTVVATAATKFGNFRAYLNYIEAPENKAPETEKDLNAYKDGGAATNVRLFGDSGKELDKLPAFDASLAVWGRADVYLRGIYTGQYQAILWRGPSIYDAEGKVWQETAKENPYNPATPAKGYVDANQEEVHLLFWREDINAINRYWHFVYEDIKPQRETSNKAK